MTRPLPPHALRATFGVALTCLAGAAPPRPLLALQAAETGRVRWSVSDDGQSWSPDDVALGDSGTAAFAGLRTTTPGLRMYSSGDPVALFDALPTVGSLVYEVKTAVAEHAPLAASISTHQTAAPAPQADIVAIVRAFDPAGDGTPLWERHLPAAENNTEPGVAVSDDGGVVLTWWSVNALGGLLVTAYDRAGSVLSEHVIEHPNGTLFPDQAQLSHDGTVAMFSLPTLGELVIYDVLAGAPLAQIPDNGIFCGSALSGDGRRFASVRWATSTQLRMELYELDDQDQPVLLRQWNFDDSVRVPAMALDYDGSRFAYALQQVSPTDTYTVVLYDQHVQAQRFAHTFAAPGSTLGNWCAELALDDDGETLAGVSWGDSLNLTPEVFAFDAGGKLLISVDAEGSGMHLALSRDGELLFAGCRGAHANVFGNGGDLYLIETRAQSLRLEGAPRVGASLDLELRAGAEFDRVLLVATKRLLPFPSSDLRLDASSSRRIVGLFPLAAGALDGQLALPAGADQIGRIEHFQGLLFDDDAPGPRELTNKVSLRYLP